MCPSWQQFCFWPTPKGRQMQLTQLVYVSSYIDEFGIQLPDFIEDSAIADSASGVKGMTLFSNGNIIQLIEGEFTVVGNTFRKLAHSLDCGQSQATLLLDCAIKAASLSETSIGFALNSLRLITRPASKISLFRLNPQEVASRLSDSQGKALMLGFAETHQS